MDVAMEDMGKTRELELFDALKDVFGKECVYYSPKYRKECGEEKELSDILILALPYAISIQMKWLSVDDEDFESEKGEVIEKRVIRRMEKAAKQHNVFNSVWVHNEDIGLPRVWSSCPGDSYRLPSDLITTIMPIVVVDFEDRHYSDPSRRLRLPPVVVNAPALVAKTSVVHAFLFNDLNRILQDVFSVGDFIAYLKCRGSFWGDSKRAVFGYDELTLFSIYLTKYSLLEDLNKADGVFLMDQDIYERRMSEIEKENAARRSVFRKKDLIDWVQENLLINVEQRGVGGMSDVAYVVCMSRLKCLRSINKRMLSEKMKYCWGRVVYDGCVNHFTYGITNDGIMDGNALIIVCTSLDNDSFVKQVQGLQIYAYQRFLTAMHSRFRDADALKEVLCVIFNSTREKMFVGLIRVRKEDFDCLLTGDEAEEQAKHLTGGHFSMDEWEFTRRVENQKGVDPSV